MTYDGSNRKQVREREKELKIAESNRLAYTRRIMSDTAGRKWMYDLLTRCHIGATGFVSGHQDQTAFNLGEQNIGLQYWNDAMNAAPQEYVLMMNEANIKEAVHDRRYSDDRSPAASELPGSQDPGRDDSGPGPAGEYDPYTRDLN